MAILTKKSLDQWKQQQFEKQQGKCLLCGLPLDSWQKSAGDHNHHTGAMRGLLHPLCNTFEGKVTGLMYRAGLKGKVDFADVLANLAKYWRQDYQDNPVHPSFVLDQSKKFAKFTREKMIKELNSVGCDVDKTYSREQLVDIFKKKYRESLQ
ncbi:endonuclease domain-containing protein [Atlantibacter hermannii]|uniref:endonuclease domain-containing protein n=1 Tax=Atlantibacter hermannii TaxID=565 RepID=UPI0028ADA01E|nr:endonuclease domain-containing protein [Atlantibacter hermannii]